MSQTPGPLIVQSDRTLLLEVDHPLADECRHAIAPFAELERAPEHIHTYRLTPLGLWNAMAAGHDAEQVVDVLPALPVSRAGTVGVCELVDERDDVLFIGHRDRAPADAEAAHPRDGLRQIGRRERLVDPVQTEGLVQVVVEARAVVARPRGQRDAERHVLVQHGHRIRLPLRLSRSMAGDRVLPYGESACKGIDRLRLSPGGGGPPHGPGDPCMRLGPLE